MEKQGGAKAARCGVIRTRAVSRISTIMLLRVRYLLEPPGRPTLLAEEVVVVGATHGSRGGKIEWLSNDEAPRLLAEARPDANVPMAEKHELIDATSNAGRLWKQEIRPDIEERAEDLEKSREHIRKAITLRRSPDSPSPRNCHQTCSGSSSCNRWSDHVALSVGSKLKGDCSGLTCSTSFSPVSCLVSAQGDFRLAAKRNLTDEIASAFADTRVRWGVFQHRLERLAADDLATKVTG